MTLLVLLPLFGKNHVRTRWRRKTRHPEKGVWSMDQRQITKSWHFRHWSLLWFARRRDTSRPYLWPHWQRPETRAGKTRYLFFFMRCWQRIFWHWHTYLGISRAVFACRSWGMLTMLWMSYARNESNCQKLVMQQQLSMESRPASYHYVGPSLSIASFTRCSNSLPPPLSTPLKNLCWNGAKYRLPQLQKIVPPQTPLPSSPISPDS